MKFTINDFYIENERQLSAIMPSIGVAFRAMTPEEASESVNAKIEEWLNTSSTVYGYMTGPSNRESSGWTKSKLSDDTHKAKLVCIEKLDE